MNMTDFKAMSEKKNVWAEIAKSYNAFENVRERSEKLQKKCWDNMKTRAKTKVAEERRERLLTGGGTVKDVANDSDRQVRAMVADQIQPLKNSYDADAGSDDAETAGDEQVYDTNGTNDINGTKTIISPSTSGMTTTTSPSSNKIPSIQKKILERQEEEHRARMTRYKRKLEMKEKQHAMKEEKHKMKMRCLGKTTTNRTE